MAVQCYRGRESDKALPGQNTISFGHPVSKKVFEYKWDCVTDVAGVIYKYILNVKI